jgi:hypothetical protein
MSVELDLAVALTKALDDAIADARDKLPRALPYDQYQQSCGMIVAWQQIRDLLPDLVEQIQKR